ncbi:non-specific lipid-transfer protein 13-like [Tripterygium wilfordii]|uniref:Non-specific lipid-transfer protein 13-like n=1 Tax=Tripterygium wilfordii TaxID=458696 RepID=A0A7J7DCV1_TRIWF|nr:non-specific lipid-transfer protein 13-like [Tripterygium wilfordii]
MSSYIRYILLFLLISQIAVTQSRVSLCEGVADYFTYCLNYLVGFYYKPTTKCCKHIKKLNTLAKHRFGPRNICWCIEYMMKGAGPPLLSSRIDELPAKCHTHLSFPISESMDCNK